MTLRTDYNEQWDELVSLTMEQEYTRLGVMPGDHLGYFLARLDEVEGIVARRLTGPDSGPATICDNVHYVSERLKE